MKAGTSVPVPHGTGAGTQVWHPHAMTPELAHIVEDAYRIFGAYRHHGTLTVCHCNVCMTEESERALLKTPLRDIPSSLLAEYTNSAHDWNDGPVLKEMRYFLPRYLDLIAVGAPPCNMGLDICLRRLAHAGWRMKWPDREIECLDRFFDALMRQSLDNLDLVLWPVGWRLDFRIADVLTCAVSAGADLARVLKAWDEAPDPAASIHMAAAMSDLIFERDRTYFHSAYLDREPDAANAIGAFLTRAEVKPRIEAAFFMIEDPRLQEIVSNALV